MNQCTDWQSLLLPAVFAIKAKKKRSKGPKDKIGSQKPGNNRPAVVRPVVPPVVTSPDDGDSNGKESMTEN